jgi:glycosyltransferase involved in cell wall biosynthesis
MIKVLHIHSGNLYGGVETFLATLARSRQLAPSMEMSVALCFDDRIAAELRGEGVPTSILGAVRLRRPDTVLRARRALTQLLRGGDFDVAVCHQAWPLAIFGPVVKAAHLPLVSWIHMVHGRHWIDRLASRVEPDLIVCNSNFTASQLSPTPTRVEVVYAPVGAAGGAALAAPKHAAKSIAKAPFENGIRDELNTPAGDVVIIQVSRMEAWKGQAPCLEALAQLRDRPGWTCWQVGGAQRPMEERYVASLRSSAERFGIHDRVRFLGQRFDVPRLLAAADIFCQPNLLPEPFGISFVEAMAAGLPVVTSDIGGAREIVDDTCGCLVPVGNCEALTRQLAALIVSHEQRTRLGSHGPLRAQTLCDPAVQMPKIAALLADAHRDAEVPDASGMLG